MFEEGWGGGRMEESEIQEIEKTEIGRADFLAADSAYKAVF